MVFENDSIIGACYFFAGVKGAKILIFTVKVEVVLGISFRSLFSCTPLQWMDVLLVSFFNSSPSSTTFQDHHDDHKSVLEQLNAIKMSRVKSNRMVLERRRSSKKMEVVSEGKGDDVLTKKDGFKPISLQHKGVPDLSAMKSDVEVKEEKKEVEDDDESGSGFITSKKSIGLKLVANFVRSNPEFIKSASTSTAAVDNATGDFSFPT